MKEVNQRLKRLIESDVCQAEDYEKYRDELLQLTQQLVDPKTMRKQINLFKALSDENRLKILKLLELREMCVCELMIALDMTQPNLSHHLRILENQDIVRHTKKGRWAYYSLTNQKNIENITKIGLL